MFNLKEAKGTYKQLIGECMFKLTNHYAVITRYWNKRRFFDIFEKYLTRKQMEFLNDYWYSLDAMEIDFSTGQIYLYQIKTKNIYNKPLNFKPKLTQDSFLLYKKASDLGFQVKLVFVCLHEDWNYSIKFSDFSEQNFVVESPKPHENLYDFV